MTAAVPDYDRDRWAGREAVADLFGGDFHAADDFLGKLYTAGFDLCAVADKHDHTCDSRLVVTTVPYPSVGLRVDAEALMDNPHQARFWLLTPEDGGIWSHGQSGTSGPLAEMLGAITDVYRHRQEVSS